jgi:hypothetical protein
MIFLLYGKTSFESHENRGLILENHGMPLSLQISFFLYRKWHAIIFKNRAPVIDFQKIVPDLSRSPLFY